MEKKELDTKTVRKYWREVINKAFAPAWSEFGMRVFIIGLALALLITAFSGLFAAFGIVPIPFFAFQIDRIHAGLQDFVAAIGILIILFLIMIWRIPAEMDEEKQEKIEGLIKKTIDANIDIKIFPRQTEGYASIVINNRENDDIDNYAVYLLNVSKIDEDGNERAITDMVNPDNAFISQGGGNIGRDKIRRNDKSTFNIALQNGDTFLFLFNNGGKSPADQGLYKLEIGFDGDLDNKRINRITKTCFLEYFTQILEIPRKDWDEVVKEVKKATYIDIRENKDNREGIYPSSLSDLPGNDFFRYIASHGIKGRTINDQKDNPKEDNP